MLIRTFQLATTALVLEKCYYRAAYDGAIRPALHRKLPAILMADKL
jgi:hypothetical protein